jgi:hypothetical protein
MSIAFAARLERIKAPRAPSAHPRASGNPARQSQTPSGLRWGPAFAGTSGTSGTGVGYAPRARHSVEFLRGALLWLTGLAGAFAFMEPSPYEIMALLTILFFAVSGLSLRAALIPFTALLILYSFGFAAAVVPVLDKPKTLLWVLVSGFLAVTSLFFASMLGRNTQARLKVLMRGTTAAGAVAAVAAIVGYFHLLSGSDILLLYDRARGTFNDPNVLGAFLVLPSLLALQRILAGRLIEAGRAALLLLLLGAGMFLSFSRGAWGQFAFAASLMMLLEFVTTRSPRERARIVLLALLGAMALAVLVAALLSIPQVADLFKERAALEQSYDAGPTGRFGRHVLGLLLALDTPLGIGPLQFHTIFPEDPHNSYLNAFMSGGWISGVAYPALVFLTVILGFRHVFVRVPWQRAYLAVFSAFLATVGESFVIDTDHWRHFWMMLGTMWGMFVAAQSYKTCINRPVTPDTRLEPASLP